MKYGRLIYDEKSGIDNKQVFCNYGDNIQIAALDNLYHYMNIPDSEIININIYDLPNYDGEYAILPMNCCLWTCDPSYFLPASHKIIPVFIGTHFRIPPTDPSAIDYLKRFSPIGCRDYSTYQMMLDLNVPSYLNGCMTAALPKRRHTPSQKKVFFVDVPDSLFNYVPEDILKYSEIVSQVDFFSNDIDAAFYKTHKKTHSLYDIYRTNATLVVTSRLHCASPCMAMGIPVIIARENHSCRFEWINKYLRTYTPDLFDQIDWNPPSIDLEDFKRRLLHYNAKRVADAFDQYKDMCEISEFYEGCDHTTALSVPEQFLSSLQHSGKKEYIIWGVGGYLGNAIHQIIQKEYPDAKLVAAIDEFKDCSFHGLQTIRSDQLEKYPEAFVFIATSSGTPMAEKKLQSLGRLPNRDYFGFSSLD